MFLIYFLQILTNIIHHQVLFLFILINIDKDADSLQSDNMEDFSNDIWLLFSTLPFFLKVWFNNRSNKKVTVFVILIICTAFLHKHVKTSDHREAIRGCIRH